MKRCDAFSLIVSEALDRARRLSGLTQTDLAAKANRSRQAVSAVLDGHTARTSTYALMAEALDCDVVVTFRPRRAASPAWVNGVPSRPS